MVDIERLEREREFHNARFDGGDNRETQSKYYWAIRDGAERYIELVKDLVRDRDVLEYGCGSGGNAREFGHRARNFQAIDISDTAIEAAQAANVYQNVRFSVMDAMNMSFADQSFDCVFGSGIIHHLDTDRAASEIARVLRPGGRAVFWEPLGLNPMINAYRFLTPSARTPDEHPLLPVDFRIMRQHFAELDLTYFGLTTLGAVPFRNNGIGNGIWHVTKSADSLLLKLPGLRLLAWYVLIDCRK